MMDWAVSRCADLWQGRAMRSRLRALGGFTLIEVLIALTLIAIALMSALRATGALSTQSADLRLRTLAQWSAENRLAWWRLQDGLWPEPGVREFECAQGLQRLMCREEVSNTPNPFFRRIDVSVHATPADDAATDGSAAAGRAASGAHRLARLTGFITLPGGRR